jgi:hypothetical protein
MTVIGTSIKAYEMSYPKHGTNRYIVLKTIEMLGKCTDFQIAETLLWKINSVTPRRNELVHCGLIEAYKEMVDPLTNTMATWWHIKK